MVVVCWEGAGLSAGKAVEVYCTLAYFGVLVGSALSLVALNGPYRASLQGDGLLSSLRDGVSAALRATDRAGSMICRYLVGDYCPFFGCNGGRKLMPFSESRTDTKCQERGK